MWIEINTETLQYKQDELPLIEESDSRRLLASSTLKGKINRVEDLASLEYGHAVEINLEDRSIKFGRDYLGHFPLQYAMAGKALIISDEIGRIAPWLKSHGTRLTVSEEAIALYMILGYVPQGMAVFNEIHTAENAAYYLWEKNVLKKISTFTPVEHDPTTTLTDLKDNIASSLDEYVSSFPSIDVWCSGGLDSSIMAFEAKRTGKPTTLNTISYTEEASRWCNEKEEKGKSTITYSTMAKEPFELGELSYVKLIGEYFNLPVNAPVLKTQHFWDQSQKMLMNQPNPIIDLCVPVKYALSSNTKTIAITGEGGDPIFSGTKNNFVSYMRQNQPDMPLGWVYALSHLRCGLHFDKLLKNNLRLKTFVTEYLQELIDRFPGSLVKKLLYLNTFIKQGSLIFLESYYGAKQYGTQVRHPLTSLSVYKAGFQLPDESKYVYPKGKIALSQIYRDHLPMDTIEREKSGTIVPLEYFMTKANRPSVDNLYDMGLFDNDYLRNVFENEFEADNLLLSAGLRNLSKFLTCHG